MLPMTVIVARTPHKEALRPSLGNRSAREVSCREQHDQPRLFRVLLEPDPPEELNTSHADL